MEHLVTGSDAAPALAGLRQPCESQAASPNMVVLLLLRGCAPRVLAEELMQKTRHHREVGHLGCVIQDTLGKSMGGGKKGGEEEEEKTEF